MGIELTPLHNPLMLTKCNKYFVFLSWYTNTQFLPNYATHCIPAKLYYLSTCSKHVSDLKIPVETQTALSTNKIIS